MPVDTVVFLATVAQLSTVGAGLAWFRFRDWFIGAAAVLDQSTSRFQQGAARLRYFRPNNAGAGWRRAREVPGARAILAQVTEQEVFAYHLGSPRNRGRIPCFYRVPN